MPTRQEVVVVDGVPETAEVLRAVFEPRGIDVSRRRATLAHVDHDHSADRPESVIVLHEAIAASAESSRVIVGRIGRQTGSTADDRHVLSQPFHYAELIAAIDAIVAKPAA